jgi:NAD-dependent DNA ligase
MRKEIQLDTLNGNGFTIPKGDIFTGHLMTDVYMTDYLNKLRDNSEYEIDGVVIEVCETNLRKKINPTKNTLNPEYARKFKVADASNLAVAEVIEVEWNISKNGYLKPRVRIQPTELVGVTVKHATGFNAAFILNNGIGPGAKIRITRSGDVIPFILGVVESVAPQMPEEEDVRWTVNNKGEKVDLVLEDLNNETVQLEQMIDFFGKVGTEYLGEGNLKTIFDAGFTTIQDAINLSEGEWVNMIGANGKKIHKSIREKLTNIPWYIVAGAHPAFGRGVGVRKMKKLYDAFAGDMNLLNSVSAMVAVEGFDEKTATKISSGFTTFLIFRNETGIKFAEYEAPKGGDLSGQSFLFTGFRDKGLEKKIEEKGGKNSSAVSSKLTYLVALDPNEDSGKLKKARDLGTKIITRDQLMEILK